MKQQNHSIPNRSRFQLVIKIIIIYTNINHALIHNNLYVIYYSNTSLKHHASCITGTQCCCKYAAIWNFRYQ